MIYNKYLDSDFGEKVTAVWEYLKKGVNLSNIIFVILSLLVSSQSFMGEYEPFQIVVLGAASVFNVPLILVLISSIVGLAITHATTISVLKIIAMFVIFSLITAFINIEGISKKYGVFIKLIISYFLVELVSNLILGTFFSSILSIFTSAIIISILYFIFVPGISVIINLRKSYVYSKEESIAMLTVIAIALLALKSVNLFGFSIYNILIMILILIYGWKNGAILGSTAGLLIGLLLTGIIDTNMSFVVSLAVSGGVAGILSRFGKIAIIVGFILGNIYISYHSSGFSELTMRLSEMLIASISLLFMPKAVELKFDKLFNKNRTLEKTYGNVLGSANEAKEKISAVSEVFESLADIEIEKTPESTEETKDVIKKYILDYIENKCIDCKDKKNCLNNEKLDITVDYIVGKLENNEKIMPSMLDFKCYLSDEIIPDILEIYNGMKLTRVLKKKEKESSEKMSNQYKELSKILSTVAKNIKENLIVKDKSLERLREELKFYGYIVYEDSFKKEDDSIEYVFVTDILTNIDMQKKEIIEIASNILEQTMAVKLILNSSKKEKSRIKLVSKPDFDIQTSIVSEIKSGEEISGDSYISMELSDLKNLTVISDGAGSGSSAAKASNTIISMFEKLLAGGFSEEKALEIINSVIKLKSDDTNFSTIDALIFDLKNANAQFIKFGAAPTYIIEDGKVVTINTSSMPIGVISDTDYMPICKKIKNNSVIIQLSDGVIKEGMDINNNYFKNHLLNIDVNKSSRAISADLRKFILKEHKGLLDDDITIIISKVVKS